MEKIFEFERYSQGSDKPYSANKNFKPEDPVSMVLLGLGMAVWSDSLWNKIPRASNPF
jgi:hypothetical protein